MQTPLLTFLRRLEAQNIWRVTYNALPQQQQQQYSTSHSGQDSQQQGARGRQRMCFGSSCLFSGSAGGPGPQSCRGGWALGRWLHGLI